MGGKESPLYSHDIPQIQELDNGKSIVAEIIPTDVELDLPAGITEITEDGLPMAPDSCQPARDRHLFSFQVSIMTIGCCISPVETTAEGPDTQIR